MNPEMREKLLNLYEALFEKFCNSGEVSLKEFLAKIERQMIVAILEHTNGDRSKASEILGIRRTTLHNKIKRYHIHIHFHTLVI